MKQFGKTDEKMQSMNVNDIFSARLHLLIIMAKAALKGYPTGGYRKQAVIENANTLHAYVEKLDFSFLKLSSSSHLFRQRLKLLCVMATAIVSETYPLGIYRQKAIEENIDTIIQIAFPQTQMEWFDDILKVA